MENSTLTTLSTALNIQSKSARNLWRRWKITINNPVPDDITLITLKFKEHVMGREIGESGTKHIHVYGRCAHEVSWETVKSWFPRADIEHITGKKGREDGWIDYCIKSDTLYITNMEKYKRVKSPLDGKELYDWQLEIVKIIDGPVDDRKIYWYWEEHGNRGKTAFAKHLRLTRKGVKVISGKAADIKHCVSLCVPKPSCVIIDIPRRLMNDAPYDTIEEIKNGMFFSGKYESNDCVFDPPHIIIFANCEPDIEALSKDRWVIRKL